MKLTIRKRNKLAFLSAMLSAFFLFISGASGVSGLLKIKEIVLIFFNLNVIRFLFILLLVLASLGAISVFIGGFLILKKRIFWANLLIFLGSGAGILGFIFNLIISTAVSEFSIYSYLSFSSLGVIFALIAQFLSKKKK